MNTTIYTRHEVSTKEGLDGLALAEDGTPRDCIVIYDDSVIFRDVIINDDFPYWSYESHAGGRMVLFQEISEENPAIVLMKHEARAYYSEDYGPYQVIEEITGTSPFTSYVVESENHGDH